jgi:PBP1b-binding outer membrane lipoprotein LpoB
MRRFAAISILALVLAACANEPVAPTAGSSEPGPDQTRLGIYETLSGS